jgi:hypothetical protein
MTKLNSSFRDGVQVAWDSTSISCAMTCPRKYYYQMIRNLRPMSKSVHLIFGGHYATALEHFYKHRALGASIEEATLLVVREAMENTWRYETCLSCTGRGTLSPEQGGGLSYSTCDDCNGQGKVSLGPVEFLDSKKTRFNLIRSIVWYIDTFGEESANGIQTHHLSDGKPAVELSFTLDLDEDFLLCGHLDRVVDYGGSLYVMDQKTTGGTISSYFFDGFKPDVQMSLYAFAGQIILKSPVAGVIIDGAQIAVSFTRFERGFTYRTQDELEEFYENTKHIIRQTQSYTMLDVFPMNTTACGNYGGCPYKSICTATPKLRESVIKSQYREETWDPLERR